MKSRFAKIATFMLAVIMLSSITSTSAFAKWDPDKLEKMNDPEYVAEVYANMHDERVQKAKLLAQQIMDRIDALPDNAGIAEKEEIESIRNDLKGYQDPYSITYTNGIYEDERVSYYISAEHMRKLEAAEERVANPQAIDYLAALVKNPTASDEDQTMPTIMLVLIVAWEIIWIIQTFLAYGTAYRKTKAKGDNGVSLFGWMLLYDLAALVPGLGFYLWHRSKKPNS